MKTPAFTLDAYIMWHKVLLEFIRKVQATVPLTTVTSLRNFISYEAHLSRCLPTCTLTKIARFTIVLPHASSLANVTKYVICRGYPEQHYMFQVDSSNYGRKRYPSMRYARCDQNSCQYGSHVTNSTVCPLYKVSQKRLQSSKFLMTTEIVHVQESSVSSRRALGHSTDSFK